MSSSPVLIWASVILGKKLNFAPSHAVKLVFDQQPSPCNILNVSQPVSVVFALAADPVEWREGGGGVCESVLQITLYLQLGLTVRTFSSSVTIMCRGMQPGDGYVTFLIPAL